MHLVYFTKRPLSERDARRFGVEEALQRGHRVTVIDLNDMIFPRLADDSDPYYERIPADLHVIRRWKDFFALESMINKADLVISLVRSFGMDRRSLPTFRMLAKTATPYLILAPLVDPAFSVPHTRKSLLTRALSKLSSFQFDELAASVLSRIPLRRLGLPTARYVVYNGTASIFPNVLVGPNTAAINSHAHDYDLYLEAQAKGLPEKAQAVFLDQCIPFHPDARAKGIPLPDPAVYYRELGAVFSQIETELGLEVVIAAHPRTPPGELEAYAEGRRIIQGNSAEAVMESRLVLTHFSRSTNFAILARKPVCFLMNQWLLRWTDWMPAYIDAFCASLGTAPRFYDAKQGEGIPLQGIMDIDQAAFEAYETQFIKAPASPQRAYWDIVFDKIESDCEQRAFRQ